jgi:hypothetical protein
MFRGEDGHSIVVNYPLVTLERNPYAGRPQIEKNTTLTARPGNYILHVQVLGYEDHRAEIVLKKDPVYHEVILKPVRRPAAR